MLLSVPKSLEAYLACYVLRAPTLQAELGPQGCDAHTGLFQIDINYREGGGPTEALSKADLVTALNGAGPFTVFAPTNAAFQELFTVLGVSGIDDLSAEALTPILLYHVLGTQAKSIDLSGYRYIHLGWLNLPESDWKRHGYEKKSLWINVINEINHKVIGRYLKEALPSKKIRMVGMVNTRC